MHLVQEAVMMLMLIEKTTLFNLFLIFGRAWNSWENNSIISRENCDKCVFIKAWHIQVQEHARSSSGRGAERLLISPFSSFPSSSKTTAF